MKALTLTISHRLICTVLLLYGLTLCVAMASPVINPQAFTLVCTSTGIKVIDATSGSTPSKGSMSIQHLLDCPMCLATALPASFPAINALPPRHLLSYVLQAVPAARLAAIVSAPLPARGPPALS